ncbi:cache domain-containing protein, partial [Klebsiella pneumoniae]|uniref:cache domain-containing protein n=2 Tax=Gammaproteobacteria TaxID=1236 RepID=UPI003F253902
LAARQPMISDPYQSATGKLLVSLSHPIFDRQGRYRGYVSGTLYLRQRSALHTLLGKHYYRDGSYLYVVDRHGRLLYHADGKRVGDYVVGNPAVKAVMRGERGAQQVRNHLGVAMLAGYAPVTATGWGIIA